MGARPSSFKRSGGFLNNVEGVISGYEFTDEFNGEPFKPGRDPKTKKEKFHSLYCVLSVRVDGADEDVTTTLFVGGAEDFSVEDDGHTLVPTEEGHELGANTSFAKLITSLVEAGFPETNLPEDKINYESIIGTRGRFVQRKNEADTKSLGKRKDKKTGKEYDRTDLVVETVLDLPGTAAAPAPKKPSTGGKANPPSKTAKKPAPAAAAAEPEVDLNDLAATTLVEIVAEAGGSIPKSKLSMKVLTKLMKHPQREDVRKLVFTDEFLEQDGAPWTYNKAKQTVSVE